MTNLQSGIYPASLSVLNDDLSLNEEQTVLHAEKLISQGCTGTVLAGTTGMSAYLSIRDKMNLIERASKSSKNQSMIIVPYIIMGPGLFTGAMTLGILIQTSSAFREVQGSFSLFMQNWTRITELRSIYRRLTEFEKAIGYKNPDKPTPDSVRS